MQNSIWIDLKSGEQRKESVSEASFLKGGRALSSDIIAEHVPAGADPLGPFNAITFCCGILAGTTISNANRLSVGSKSPLTGAIKESNSGGTFAYHMGRLGIRSITLEGIPPNPEKWQVIHINQDGLFFEDAADLASHGCYKKAEILTERYGKSISFAMIGPAAEKLMRSSAIAVSDPQNNPSRFCGRGGLGAVLASKGIQAIVIDPTGTLPLKPEDKDLYQKTNQAIAKLVNSTPQTSEVFRKYGTAAMVDVGQALGFLPNRNFSRGKFELSEQINGQALADLIESRGGEGKTTHGCMPGCLVKCSNVFPNEDGSTLVSPLEYETIGLMGSNLGIGDLDAIAKLNYLANDSGVDTIEAGAAIGVAMQAGLAEFGDSEAALSMMEEIRGATVFGRVLGSGADIAAKVLGVYQVPTAKGQAFPAYDPRALKGLAATYATSPMGADHTAGHTIRSNVEDHHSYVGQAEASRLSQVGVLQWDALGFCYFIGSAVPDLTMICDLIKAFHSRSFNPEQIREMAIATLTTERNFNRDAGFTPIHDRLSEYFHHTANPDTGTVCDIPDDEINDLMKDEQLT